MRVSQARRWFATSITGTLFAILMLVLAVPVAADGGGLVTQPAGQSGNSIVYVSSPGFVNTGTAVNPINNGGNFCTDPSCGVTINGQTVTFVNGQPVVFVNGQPFFVNNNNGFFCNVANGCGVPINYGGCTFNGCIGPGFNGNCAAGGCGTLGYTAAGPIVGIDQNGNPIVYDVRGGSLDTYTRGPNGVLCEADSRGNCQP